MATTFMRRLLVPAFAALLLIGTTMPANAQSVPQPIVDTLTNLNIPAGDHFEPVGGVVIPSGYTQLTVLFNLDNWQPTDNVFIFANYSTDGGVTWSDEGGVETNGGPHLDRQGNDLTGFVAGVPSGTGIKVRAHTIVPTGQKISGSITLS